MSRCELCGSQERVVVCGEAALKRGPTKQVTNVLCMRCGLVFNDPAPTDEELARYYTGEFSHDKSIMTYEEAVEALSRKMKDPSRKELRVVAFLADYLKDGVDVLDVGCSTGSLLADLRDRFSAKVTGVEPDDMYVRVGREFFGLSDVHHGFFDDYLTQGHGVFGLVVLRHVLEHLADPNKRIEQLKALLAPQGVLYLAFPNAAQMRSSRELKHCLEYGHLFTYSPWTIHHLLNKHGLKIVKWSFDDALQLQILAARIEAPYEAVGYREFTEGSDPVKLRKYFLGHGGRHFRYRILRKLKTIFMPLAKHKTKAG